MPFFYIVLIVLATALSPFFVLGTLNRVSRWRRARVVSPVVLCLLAVVGCGGSAAAKGIGGGGSTTTTMPATMMPHVHNGACDEGWADCDGSPANGCETAIASDPANCGTCDNVCPALSALAVCKGGVCQ